MVRIKAILILFGLLIFLSTNSHAQVQAVASAYTSHHPSKDKISWQRLNLLLSSMFIVVAKEGQVEHDTCLYIASRSLGLSRFAVLAEGMDEKELPGQTQWIDTRQPGVAFRLLSNTNGKKHLQLLMLLGAYYAFEPGSYYRYKDSVHYFLNKAISESSLLKEERSGRQALCLLGKIYMQANDQKGDSIFNIAINECRKVGDKETEARAFAYRGMYAAPTPTTFQQKITDLQTASDLYHTLGNAEGEINVLIGLGYMLTVTQQFDLAQKAFLKSLAIAEGIHYPYTHYITEALTNVTFFQGKFGEPFRYILQTIKVSESSRDSIGWPFFYSRLSQLYEIEGREKESRDMTHKAIKHFVNQHNPALYNILNSELARICSEGRPAEALNLIQDVSKKVDAPSTLGDMFAYHNDLVTCYLYLNDLDQAEANIKKMDSIETISEMIRGPLRGTIIADMYGFLFFNRGQYSKAKEYFEKHFTTFPYGQRTLLNELNIYRWLIKIDSIMGDNVSGVSHYKKYTQLLDSNFKISKIRQAEELQVIYETQDKVNQISTLNQQAKLEKKNLKQATLLKNLTLAGIAAVIIIAVLLYRQNLLRQKSNKVITDKNEQLQRLLTDKEWLLKEIHHRVKNNLQIVMSLLNSQSVYINNDAALTAIHDSQRRVYAMSLIHQKLYQSENISSIAMREYINELVSYVKDSFNTGDQVIFEKDIEPLELDVSQAIPLGLIINESIVNAVKYAFRDGRKGIVRIGLHHDDADHLLLCISDNGMGLPEGFIISEHSSLGLDLIRGLAKQLNGNFSILNNNGLHIRTRFAVINKQISDEALTKP